MKINLNNINYFFSGTNPSNIILKKILLVFRGLVLVILAITLVACNLPQRGSSGGGDIVVTRTPATATPPKDAGSAVMSLNRYRTYDDPNGSDIQREIGTVPLIFSFSTEGPLIVEGTGKIEWTEEAKYPHCGFTAKADGTVLVIGLFNFSDCKFDLRITTKYSQPTTKINDPDCTGSVIFSETEFSSKIEFDPATERSIESGVGDLWTVSTVKLSELNSEVVKNCKVEEMNFTPEVIHRSTQAP